MKQAIIDLLELWERVVDFTEIKKTGVPLEKLLSCISKERQREDTYKFVVQ